MFFCIFLKKKKFFASKISEKVFRKTFEGLMLIDQNVIFQKTLFLGYLGVYLLYKKPAAGGKFFWAFFVFLVFFIYFIFIFIYFFGRRRKLQYISHLPRTGTVSKPIVSTFGKNV